MGEGRHLPLTERWTVPTTCRAKLQDGLGLTLLTSFWRGSDSVYSLDYASISISIMILPTSLPNA